MKLLIKSLKILEDEAFSRNDLFLQKSFGTNLADIAENTEDALVIGLDSRWGEGKSTFAHMWRSMLIHERNMECIYFDAFKNDYIDDLFVALMGEFYTLIDAKNPTKKIDKFKKTAVSATKVIGKAGINIAARALSAGVLNTNDLFDDEIDKDITSKSSKLLDEYLSKRLSEVKKDRNSLENFKATLSSLPELIGSDKNIVVIIDELDRCKPTYALNLLEQIKHIFSVENIVFLLVLNKAQIEQIIKVKYGSSIDSNEYLQKFISIWMMFDNSSTTGSRKKYLQYCLDSIGFVRKSGKLDFALMLYTDLVSHYELSLREIEKTISYFSLYVDKKSEDVAIDYQLIPVYLFIVRVKYPEVFNKLSSKTISYNELIEETGIRYLERTTNFQNEPKEHELLVHLRFDLADDKLRRELRNTEKYYKNYRLPAQSHIISNMCSFFKTFTI